MALVSSTVLNLLNGVSQQPYQVRDTSQAKEQLNCRSDISKGVLKRPPAELLSKLNLTHNPLNHPRFYSYIYSQGIKYILVVGTNFLKVFDLLGHERHVYGYKVASSYIDPLYHLRVYSVNNTNFILNRDQKVRLKTPKATPESQVPHVRWAVVWFPPEAEKVPRIIDKYFFHLSVGRWSDASSVRHVLSIDEIEGYADAPSLEKLLQGFYRYYTAIIKDAGGILGQPLALKYDISEPRVLYLPLIDEDTYYIIKGNEDYPILQGRRPPKLLNQAVEKVTDLPSNFPYEDIYVYVKNKPLNIPEQTKEGSYYRSTSSGSWEEIVDPTVPPSVLDKSTMPYIIQENETGTFTIKQPPWFSRTVGNTTNNPDPYFVNTYINAIHYYQNRLILLSGDGVSLSESGVYDNFYRTTISKLVDSDPLLVRPLSNTQYYLTDIVEYVGILIFFSTTSQFFFSVKDSLTLSNISFTEYSRYSSIASIKPLVIGNRIFFASANSIMEYKQERNEMFLADSITTFIPTYIPRPLRYMVASEDSSMLFLFSDTTPNKVYAYSFNIIDSKKVMSAWSTWVFNSSWIIESIQIQTNKLYIIFTTAERKEYHLEVLDLNLEKQSSIHFDRSFTVRPHDTDIPYADLPTTAHLPTEQWHAIATDGLPYYTPVTWDDKAKLLRIPEDLRKKSFRVGVQYTYEYHLSPIVYGKKGRDSAQTITRVLDGRLQVRSVTFEFNNTGVFDVSVTPHNGQTRTKRYTSKTLSTVLSTFYSKDVTTTDSFRAFVMSRNTKVDIKITSNNPLPLALISYIWEGYYVRRNKMV